MPIICGNLDFLSKRVIKETIDEQKPLSFYEFECPSIIDRFESGGFWEVRYRRKEMERIVEILNGSLGDEPFLDAGCGTGEYLTLAAGAVGFVVGLDISSACLMRAKMRIRKRPLNGVHFVRACVEALPFKESCFGVVLCAEVIEHVVEPKRVISELHRVASKMIMITAPNHGIVRRVLQKVLKLTLKRSDESFGHIHILHIRQLCDLCDKLRLKNWGTKKAETLHIIYPRIGNIFPPVLDPLVSIIEFFMGFLFPEDGSVSVIIRESQGFWDRRSFLSQVGTEIGQFGE